MKRSIIALSLLASITSVAAKDTSVSSPQVVSNLDTAAIPLSSPASDKDFLRLPNGKKLTQIAVKGRNLSLIKGSGAKFNKSQEKAFSKLYDEGKQTTKAPLQWVVMNLDNGEIIDQSKNAGMKMFGASVSKIFVGAALLEEREGKISNYELQKLAEMISVSSNTAWIELQKRIGEGNPNKGRQKIIDFTRAMGYEKTRGFQGYLGKVHGNELTAQELAQFLHDTYWNKYDGAETLWKVMHTTRTGRSKANKYLPSDIYLGGKTGTYSGTTVDPETGKSKNPDGSTYKVNVRHHVVVFEHDSTQYGMALLTNKASNEHVALLAGGLFNKFIN